VGNSNALGTESRAVNVRFVNAFSVNVKNALNELLEHLCGSGIFEGNLINK
jgi:hypothetical protein